MRERENFVRVFVPVLQNFIFLFSFFVPSRQMGFLVPMFSCSFEMQVAYCYCARACSCFMNTMAFLRSLFSFGLMLALLTKMTNYMKKKKKKNAIPRL